MAQPVNLAIPVTAGVGLVAQVKVAPAGVVKVSVTELVLLLVVVVFPAASWMVTTGWVARAVSLVAVALGAGGGVGLVARVKVAPAGVVKVSVTELVLVVVVVFPAAPP